jgi:RNA polymerase sigma-70 factor (ECF subfamily)
VTTLLTGGGTRGRDTLDDDVDLARDRALVTRAQEGDRAAFDDLYMRYYRRLYRFCLRRLHDAHEAEDVAQEAFARAWRALPTFGGDRRFYPWLSVIASHLCTDVLRRRNRSTPVAEFHQGNVASTEDGGEELMLAAVDSALVAKAFTRLSDRHQRILHLREGSGWSYQRIADHEGVGITAVETLLWRARQALKREFASLAGADSRLGAWLGGLLSIASLRKLLGTPGRIGRKLAPTGAKGAALAAGSAVAATAMVIGATVSTPGAGTSSAAPVFTESAGGQLPTVLPGLPGTGSPDPTGTAADSAAGGATNQALHSVGAANPVSAPPLGGVPSLGPVNSTVTNTLQTAGSALTGAGNQIDNTLGGLVGGVNDALQGVTSTIASGALGTVGGLITGPLSSISSLLGQASSTESGTGSSGTSSGGLVGGTLGTVTNAVGGVTKTLLGGS